jgi:ATP-dependent Lhr-like helicase
LSASNAFELLDERIRHYLWGEGWDALREAQELAIPAILPCNQDVIVSAATAAGKTEAAFLPALTHILQAEPGLIIYVSPLKALINDQFGRLDRLCERLDIPVWPWHGDISASVKNKFVRERRGVLLITPESLEAMLCNRGSAVSTLFEYCQYLVVDELHAFIGSERGKQLQSLMHRIDKVLGRRVCRIGLSATLGDMALAQEFLRPGLGPHVKLVSSSSEGGELRVLLKGYEEPLVVAVSGSKEDEPDEVCPAHIATHLFQSLRGANNLIFPNSRREVERYTHLLNRLCEESDIAREFWPHHGSLSKEIREETERALKQRELPASAVCTNTLELGIDIGAVKSVAQIGPAPGVASLRQRLGRSGRRKGEPAILRGYVVENAIGKGAELREELRLNTMLMTAMVQLLVKGWFEPPRASGLHYSTLIQQVLSVIAQSGGATIAELFEVLCGPLSPFEAVGKPQFAALLRHMGKLDLLSQDSSGVLLHGEKGERLVNHYAFYASFTTEEEYRLTVGSRTLGTIPVANGVVVGQRLLFGGRTWRIEQIDEDSKTIVVSASPGGKPPQFEGNGAGKHRVVVEAARELLAGTDVPIFLDAQATRLLAEGRTAYRRMDLASKNHFSQGAVLTLLTWRGSATNAALSYLLKREGFDSTADCFSLEVQCGSHGEDAVMEALGGITKRPRRTAQEILADVKGLAAEKWDWALEPGMLFDSFASLNLDIDDAYCWLAETSPKPGSGPI